MSLQDRSVVRSAADLERKYNLSKLMGLAGNIETNSESLIKIENELNNMLNSLIINLGDVLDSQTDISLWFYSGKPTTTNAPYTNWATPGDHIGDLYYDKATGYVYKYTDEGWMQQTDTDLVSALALTNAELDVVDDNERRVYLSQPIPPYSNGDWWILEDGTLKICQLAKGPGETYDTDDFVVSSKYTTTVATKQGDEITVLKGTVLQITEDYVKYTDLQTGSSTTIAGDLIKTGTIDASKVKIANDNVVLDADGIKLKNGAKVVGNNGLMNTYLYESEGILGYTYDYEYNAATGEYDHKANSDIVLNFVVPKGLAITEAKVQLIHTPVRWDDGERGVLGYGKCHNVKIYKATNVYSRLFSAPLNAGILYNEDVTTYSEISGALGSSGWTPSINPSETNYTSETKESADIKGSLSEGLNRIKICVPDATQTWGYTDVATRSGYMYAMLKINGYMTYE